MITPEDEAFTVLVVANSRDRWVKDLQEKKNRDRQQEKQKRPDCSGNYTNTESGQNQWGGWKEEGLKLFNEYVDMNRAARKEQYSRDVEEACLARLKKKCDIVCKDFKAQAALDKKRKRKIDDEGCDLPFKKKPLATIRPQFHDIFSDDEDIGHIHCNDSDYDDQGNPSIPTPAHSKFDFLPPTNPMVLSIAS